MSAVVHPTGERVAGWLLVDPAFVPSGLSEPRTVAMVSLSSAAVSAALAVSDDDSLDAAIVRLVAQGHTQPTIARRLDVSLRTVERHLERLRHEVGVASTTELAAHFARTVT